MELKEDYEMESLRPADVAVEIDEDQPKAKFATNSEAFILPPKRLDAESLEWLRSLKSEQYEQLFEEHGYTDLSFIAGMNRHDFEAIGINKRGFVLRLEQAAKRLPKLIIDTNVPRNVAIWLTSLQLEEYTELLLFEGYDTRDDIANLKELNEDQLRAIKINKRAHVKRLFSALQNISYPKEIDGKKQEIVRIIDTQEVVNNSEMELSKWKDELKFWKKVLDESLRPLPPSFTPGVRTLQQELRSLRNLMLAILLLINLMWIILLYTLRTEQLVKYGFDPRAFQLLFLAVYGIITVIQFICMLCHRAVSLVHYAGRVKTEDFVRPDGPRDDWQDVSVKDLQK